MSSFWLTLKQQWTIKISSPLFSIFSLAAILVGSRDHRTQFWKGAIQGPFHQSLVAIGPVFSEEKIKMWNVDGRTTDDGRKVMTIAHMAWRPGELKRAKFLPIKRENPFQRGRGYTCLIPCLGSNSCFHFSVYLSYRYLEAIKQI